MAVSKRARRGGRIEVERGLITHVFNGIDVDRIQSVHIHQTFSNALCLLLSFVWQGGGSHWRRIVRFLFSVRDGQTGCASVLPIAEAWGVVQGLTPEYAHAPVASTPLPKCPASCHYPKAVLKGVGSGSP